MDKKTVNIDEKDIVLRRTFWLKIDFLKTKKQDWIVKRDIDIKQLLPSDIAEVTMHLESLRTELKKIYSAQFTQNKKEKQSYIG